MLDEDKDPYEYRFHNPEWLSIWERWCKARNQWRKSWWFTNVGELTEEYHIYNPNSKLISNPALKADAEEFLAAREAYHIITKKLLGLK